MANFLLDFLKGAIQPVIGTGEDVSNTIGNAEVNLAKRFGIQAKTGTQTNQQQFGSASIGPLGAMTQPNTPRNFASNVAQVGLDVAAPAISKGVSALARPGISAAADIGGNIAGKFGARVVGGAAKGAAEGTVVGGAQGVAQGIGGNKPITPGSLTMDFLQGAGQGAEQGAVFGPVSGIKGHNAPVTTNDAVTGPVGRVIRGVMKQANARSGLLDDETASAAAKSESPKEIEKKLEPAVGPAVAHDVAQAASQTKDPHVIQRLVENDVAKKLPNPEVTQPSLEEMQSIEQQGAATTDREQGRYMAEPDFMNAPGTESTGTSTHIGQAGALSEAQDIFNTSGDAGEALLHYMDKTGSGPEEAYKALGQYMAEANPESLNKGNINISKNPEVERVKSILPDVQPENRDQAMLAPKIVHNELNRLATAAADAGDSLSANDRNLMETIHGKTLKELLPQAEDKQAFTDAFNTLKKYDDTKQALAAQHLDVEVPYRQNHGLTMRWDNSNEEIKAAEAKKAKLSTQPGWSKGRQIANYQEGEKLGLKRSNDNIYQDLQQDLQQSQSSLGQLALHKGLEQAYPGQVKVGDIEVTKEGTYNQLQIPYGQKLSMPSAIANELNMRAPAPTATGGWKTYDTFNGLWKNLKLGGGGFHSINTLGSWFGQQLASGNVFKHPEDSMNVLRSMFDSKFTEQKINEWHNSGATLREDQAGLNANYRSAEGDISVKGKLANIPGLKQIHEAVFGRQIPFMMKSMFHQLTDDLDMQDPADRQKAIGIAKQINQQFGAFNRDIQGVTARTAKLAGRGVLAWDWNEGQIRTLADALSKGGAEGKLARQTVFGKALLFAGLATGAGLVGGEFKGKDTKQTALDILQKTINPSFQFGSYTVGLPTTQLSELGKPIAQTVSNAMTGKSLANPIKDVATSRLAAIPSAVEQIAGNRNFSGQPIAGTDYYGRPISAGQTAANIAGMAAPIPVTQGLQTATGKQDIGAAIANIAGLNVRPTYDLSYAPVAGQTYTQALQQAGALPAQIQADTQFYDLLGTLSKARKNALNQAVTDIGKKDTAKAQKDINAYNTKLIQTLQPWVKAGGTKYLDSVLLAQLRSSSITLGTASKQARTDIKYNPTAYGQPLSASSIAQQASAGVVK